VHPQCATGADGFPGTIQRGPSCLGQVPDPTTTGPRTDSPSGKTPNERLYYPNTDHIQSIEHRHPQRRSLKTGHFSGIWKDERKARTFPPPGDIKGI